MYMECKMRDSPDRPQEGTDDQQNQMTTSKTSEGQSVNSENERRKSDDAKSKEKDEKEKSETDDANREGKENDLREIETKTKSEPKDDTVQESLEQNKSSEDQEFKYNISESFYNESNDLKASTKISFVEEINICHMCEYCKFILWHPLKLKCGHTICGTCVRKIRPESTDVLNCPIDDEEMKKDEVEILESCQGEIERYLVCCISKECKWRNPLSQLQDHLNICDEFKKEQCNNCHENEFCEQETKNDPNSVMITNNEENEDIVDPLKIVQCPNSCKEVGNGNITSMQQGLLEDHLKNDCVNRRVDCLFAEHKCEIRPKFRKVPEHLIKYCIFHLNNICMSGKNINRSMEDQVRTLLQMKQKMEVNDNRITCFETTQNSQFLWKIEDIKEKYESALKGDREEIVSNAFYSTFPYGYKLVMRLKFNNKNAKNDGPYISVLISVCDNDYNGLLSWPFNQKVDIHLINQRSDQHISHSILPNPIKENYPFIQRPATERNPFYGIEKFSKCNVLSDDSSFVVDNTIFFKITIEPHTVA